MVYLELTHAQARLMRSALDLGISRLTSALDATDFPRKVTDPENRRELEDRRRDCLDLVAIIERAETEPDRI